MARFVDGFVIPIKKKKISQYKKLAKLGYKVWMEYGALDYYECVGTDLKLPWGITFPKMCKLKKDETVIFAFIVYKSKRHRDSINAKVHQDPRMKECNFEMPFEMKRFAVGGFAALVHSK